MLFTRKFLKEVQQMQFIDQRMCSNTTRFLLLQIAIIPLWFSASDIAQESDIKAYQGVDTQVGVRSQYV